jgi:hypothetical protein
MSLPSTDTTASLLLTGIETSACAPEGMSIVALNSFAKR